MNGAPSELCYLTIRQAGDLFARRKLSPVELTQAVLERIDRLDARLHSYLTVTSERAMADARAAEKAILRGESRGPLHGIPIALKDLFQTAGIRTTAHSRVLADWVPAEDATVVSRLRDAGTVLLGKLAMHEFATGLATDFAPAARNPWNVHHIPGGSSSGSGVAVASGLCAGSLGSDTGGSIRHPASFCGVVGLKPTYGRVSRHGVIPLSWTLDHCGPLARTVEDAATLLQAVAGPDPRDASSSPVPVPNYAASLGLDIPGLKVGLEPFFFDRGPEVDPEILDATEKALQDLTALGGRMVRVAVPSLRYASAAHSVIQRSESYAYHARALLRQPQDYGARLRRELRVGALFTAADYLRATRVRRVLKAELANALDVADVLVTPESPHAAPSFAEYGRFGPAKSSRFTRPFNDAGLPAISVPCGFTRAGLPIGLQIVGRPFDESTVLRVAYAYEQRTGWFLRHPPLDGDQCPDEPL